MSALTGGIERPFSRLSDRVGAVAMYGQTFVVPRSAAYDADYTENVPVPDGAAFVFAEILAPGNSGSASAGSYYTGGGGGGSDAIVAVGLGSALSVFLPAPLTNDVTATISLNGTVVVSAASGASANASQSRPGAAGTGKYPGTVGASGSSAGTGRGGGRLAGKPSKRDDIAPRPTGAGCGGAVQSSNGSYRGGQGQAMLTLFGDYDSALAFAKSVYGGAWTP